MNCNVTNKRKRSQRMPLPAQVHSALPSFSSILLCILRWTMFAKGCWGVDHLINPPLRHCPNYTPSHGNIDCWKNFVIQSWQRSLRWVPQYRKDLSNWQCTLLENCNIVIRIEYLRYGTIIIKKTVIWNADLVDFEVESSKTWNLIMVDLVDTNV